MALSCIISEIFVEMLVFNTACIRRPRWAGPRWTIAIPFAAEKLQRSGYPMVQKLRLHDTFSRFDRIPACWLRGAVVELERSALPAKFPCPRCHWKRNNWTDNTRLAISRVI